MSFSANVVANIKTIVESEDEDYNGHTLLEALKELPVAPDAAVAEAALANAALNDPTEEFAEDPLLSSAPTRADIPFRGEYDEQDFLYEYSDEEDKPVKEERPIVMAAPSRHKKARTSTALKGRNGHLWCTTKPTQRTITDVTVQQMQPRGKGPAATVSNPLEAWLLLMDERILTQIVNHTNEAIRRQKGKAYHERPTDVLEMRAWLGLNYLCGIFRNSPHSGPLDELWTWELGNSIFRATMSSKRFVFLADCLHCSESNKPTKKSTSADYAQVLDLWEKFWINCRSYYSPSGNCTIDAHTMQGTKAKAGARLLTLCDAKTLYMCNAVVVTDDLHRERNVLQLVCDIKGTQRNVVLPEQHTTLELANKLLQKQLTVVGVLPANAKEAPPELLSMNSPQTLYSDAATLRANEEGSGFLLSTGLPTRVNVAKLHQLSCDACRNFHLTTALYSTKYAEPAANESWSLRFFHQLLDYAAFNAWILLRLSERGNAVLTQREFQRDLGLYLTQQQLKRQLQGKSKLTLPQKLQVCEVLGEPTGKLLSNAVAKAAHDDSSGTMVPENAQLPEGITLKSKVLETRVRCRKCRGKRNCTTKTRCQQCLRPLCYRYLYTRCEDCMGLAPQPPPP